MKKRKRFIKAVPLFAAVALMVCGCANNNAVTETLPLTSGDVVSVTCDGGWSFDAEKKTLSKDDMIIYVGFVNSDNYDDNLELFKRYKNQGIDTVEGKDVAGNQYIESVNSVSSFRMAWLDGSNTGYIMRTHPDSVDGYSHVRIKPSNQ